MSVTKADVVAIAPELSAVPDPTFAIFIADSEVAFDLNAYDANARSYIQRHLVAFMMVEAGLGTGASARGQVTSESVGDVSRTFSVPGAGAGASENDLSRNRYGRVVLRYRRQRGVHIAWVGP